MARTSKTIEDYGISEDSLRIVRMLDSLLEQVTVVFESNGVPLPARQYWMLGSEYVEDCEQVVVTFVQGYLGSPGDQASEPQSCNQPKTAVLTVNITRNHPIGENGKAVAPERIISASSWGAIDSATLLFNLDALTSILGWSPVGAIATVMVSPPNGGVQTTTLNLSMVIP